jgi:hypothetical protein
MPQQIEILFHMLKKNNNICKNWTCEMRKMQFIFSVSLNGGYIAPPKNLDVPSKMKVTGYMYP